MSPLVLCACSGKPCYCVYWPSLPTYNEGRNWTARRHLARKSFHYGSLRFTMGLVPSSLPLDNIHRRSPSRDPGWYPHYIEPTIVGLSRSLPEALRCPPHGALQAFDVLVLCPPAAW